MQIIFVRDRTGSTSSIKISRGFVFFLITLFLALPIGIYFFGKYSVDAQPIIVNINQSEYIEPIRKELNKVLSSVYQDILHTQQEDLEALKQYNQENINALTKKLAALQAHIMRLDSLGNNLIEVAHLDKTAFNFDQIPSIGGSSEANEYNLPIKDVAYDDFIQRLQQISLDIETRSKQLSLLENLLIAEQLNRATTPSGKPAEKGWLSSYYGQRIDPFTKRKRMHKGVDIAGKSGSNIIATADGIVTTVEKQNGYGKVIEIDHGYGLSTRYGHNKIISVEVGDKVKQGQVIAKMGSTGRSTGPHVHYEILLNGRQINPQKYLSTAHKNF